MNENNFIAWHATSSRENQGVDEAFDQMTDILMLGGFPQRQMKSAKGYNQEERKDTVTISGRYNKFVGNTK